MKPEKNQHVKCILKNNALVEGIVDQWEDSQVLLKSLDGKSLFIIHNGPADIVFTKVILEEVKLSENVNINTVLATKLKETLKVSDEDPDLQNKSVQELVHLRNEQERKIITDKLKDHSVSEVRTIKYGTPQFFKVKRPQ